jgi:hypothetical protein
VLFRSDQRSGATERVYAQRISAGGAVQWPADGVSLCAATGSPSYPTITSDGASGAIVAWRDSREVTTGNGYDIYAQRISDGGAVQWAAAGVALCTAIGYQDEAAIASDGAGGAIVTWRDQRGAVSDVYVQRISAGGAVQWADNGLAICGATGEQWYPAIVPDGASGAIVTWWDFRTGGADIYAERISAGGAALWTANGVAVCTATGNQQPPAIVSDGANGAIVGWSDPRSGSLDIYAQRISAGGAVQWTAEGVALCTANADQREPDLTPDGAGGAVVAWYDYRNGNYDIYAQRIAADGGVQWTADGVALCTAAGSQAFPAITSDDAGGAIVAWQDGRGGSGYDLYAQRVLSNGQVGIGIGWSNLQWPSAVVVVQPDSVTTAIYGQAYIPVVTALPGATTGLVAELGYGPDGSNPAMDSGSWHFVSAAYRGDVGNNDEFITTLTVTTPGLYDYCYRYSYYGGPWLYADLDGTNNGYSPGQAGALTVGSSPPPIGWANLQWPSSMQVHAGDTSETVYGQAWIDGVTSVTGPTAGLVAQLGYGLNGSDPATSPSWVWTPAAYAWEVGNNDEFTATLTVATPGEFGYCYRYSYFGGPWLYADLDGTNNGYSPGQAGALTVTPTSGVEAELPAQLSFALQGANPLAGSTRLRFGLPKRARVELGIHDVAGRRVATLATGEFDAGYHTMSWKSASAAPAGVYFARFRAEGRTFTRRLTVLR